MVNWQLQFRLGRMRLTDGKSIRKNLVRDLIGHPERIVLHGEEF
jgi:hypothetical protein